MNCPQLKDNYDNYPAKVLATKKVLQFKKHNSGSIEPAFLRPYWRKVRCFVKVVSKSYPTA